MGLRAVLTLVWVLAVVSTGCQGYPTTWRLWHHCRFTTSYGGANYAVLCKAQLRTVPRSSPGSPLAVARSVYECECTMSDGAVKNAVLKISTSALAEVRGV